MAKQKIPPNSDPRPLAPELVLPVTGETIQHLAARARDSASVRRRDE